MGPLILFLQPIFPFIAAIAGGMIGTVMDGRYEQMSFSSRLRSFLVGACTGVFCGPFLANRFIGPDVTNETQVAIMFFTGVAANAAIPWVMRWIKRKIDNQPLESPK